MNRSRSGSSRTRLAVWIVLGVGLGCLASVGLLAGVRLTAPAAPAGAPGLTVLPRASVTPSATLSPTQQPTTQSTDQPTGVAAGGPVGRGMLVEIVGTGTDGLRLRAAPGLQSATNLVAVENEVFEVQDGPDPADGLIWWYLVNPYDNRQYGWGVEEYLQPVTGG